MNNVGPASNGGCAAAAAHGGAAAPPQPNQEIIRRAMMNSCLELLANLDDHHPDVPTRLYAD
jgi:hypothetical protein